MLLKWFVTCFCFLHILLAFLYYHHIFTLVVATQGLQKNLHILQKHPKEQSANDLRRIMWLLGESLWQFFRNSLIWQNSFDKINSDGN